MMPAASLVKFEDSRYNVRDMPWSLAGEKKRRFYIIIICAVMVFGVPYLVLFLRSPVLVLTDLSSVTLYGEARIKRQINKDSLTLFRRVIPILIADDAASDTQIIAITSAMTNSRPFCVLFPIRFFEAAGLFNEQFPDIPAVILEARGVDNRNYATLATEDYYRYKTDIEADYYQAGLYAGIFTEDLEKRTLVYMDPRLEVRTRTMAREALFRGLQEQEIVLDAIYFNHFSATTDLSQYSCIVLAGSGVDILENQLEIPVILFSWLDPALIPNDILIILDDSPWVQLVPAVRMVAAGEKEGLIPSNILVLSSRFSDKDILRKVKKASE